MNFNSKSIISLSSILLLSLAVAANKRSAQSSSTTSDGSETVSVTQTITETSEKTRNNDYNSTTNTQARNALIMQSTTTFVTGFDVRSNDSPSVLSKGSICLIASLIIGGAFHAL